MNTKELKCLDLAKVFLEDFPGREDEAYELAKRIQTTIEDFLTRDAISRKFLELINHSL